MLLVARAVVSEPRLVVVDGLLDGLLPETRDHLSAVLCRPDAPWTLLLLTADPDALPPQCLAYTLTPRGLDARPAPHA